MGGRPRSLRTGWRYREVVVGGVERIHYTDNTDLWFALRGAGTSFAIVTEFVVNVFPRPETLPIIMPVDINSVEDFARIEVNLAYLSK